MHVKSTKMMNWFPLHCIAHTHNRDSKI